MLVENMKKNVVATSQKTSSKRVQTTTPGIFYKEVITTTVYDMGEPKEKVTDKVYMIRYKIDGKDKLITIGKYSQGIREEYCKQKLNEVLVKERLGEDVGIKHKKQKVFTLQNAFDEYMTWAKGNKKTWGDDEHLYRNHISELGRRELTTLKAKDFEALKQKKIQKLSPRTVEYILATARHIINYAIRNELVKNYTNPISNKKVRMPKVDNAKLIYLSYEQAKAFLDALKNEHKGSYYFSVLMLFTGARFDEVARLTWQEIDFDHGTIHIHPSKNGNARKIAITPMVLGVLHELQEHKESNQSLVIPNSQGKRWERMPKQWQPLADKMFAGNTEAGKYRITPHTLRHTHASWLAKNGTDILRIKEQLGHKKLDMTLRYAHLIPDARHEKTKELYEKFEGEK